jgi:O-antigen/teichoic acid export membrane protein
MGLRNYLLQIMDLFRTQFVRDTGKVFLGNLGGQGINFLAILLLIRNLEPDQFGVFSTALAVMMLASQFSDLGITTGFVRYASAYLKDSPSKADALFKITLYFKLAVGLVVFVGGEIAAPLVADRIFHLPRLVPLLQVAFLGSLGLTLWGFLQAVLQAREWFAKYAWINVFNNALKLLGICALLLWHQLSVERALWVMALVPFVGFLLDGLLVPKGFLRANIRGPQEREIFKELFHFSKWVTMSTLCTMFLMRLDVLMLQGLTDSKSVGIYSSANQLAMIFPLLTNSLTIALLPKISKLRVREELLGFYMKVIKLIPFIAVALIVMLTISDTAIIFLFGDKYAESVPIFKIFIIAYSLSIILNPIALTAYSLNKPNILFVMNLMQLIIFVPLNLLLIPRFGAIGASWTVLTIRVFALFFVSYWVLSSVVVKFKTTKYS